MSAPASRRPLAAPVHLLRLYVAGASPNSARAVANLRALYEGPTGVRYRLEIVDVLQQPGRALDDGVVCTPTLVRVAPDPVVTLVGDLSARAVAVAALGLADQSESPAGGEVKR